MPPGANILSLRHCLKARFDSYTKLGVTKVEQSGQLPPGAAGEGAQNSLTKNIL